MNVLLLLFSSPLLYMVWRKSKNNEAFNANQNDPFINKIKFYTPHFKRCAKNLGVSFYIARKECAKFKSARKLH